MNSIWLAMCCCNNCRLQGSQDARKAKLYGKLGKLIVQAVKAGGPNQETNPLLKEALRQAHQAQLPKDVVDRNMKKASDKSQADFREVNRHSAAARPACTRVPVLCADSACRAVLGVCTGCCKEQWGAELPRWAEVKWSPQETALARLAGWQAGIGRYMPSLCGIALP